ncbi:MAG: leucyl/phenylalanyl-tRNA--protein transferase [Flavobacteriaceae bacterium]|nr:leucyl/phenylalanyl-tRNA--protein transferase [Flavobacteriaceae bacterium]
MFILRPQQAFPPVSLAQEDGLLAVGTEMSVERLIEAYHKGIFPWYNGHEPVLWWAPNPRMVLFPNELKVSKSMQKVLSNNQFQITYNQDFETVIKTCGQIERPGQNGTWISDEIIDNYLKLHQLGWAKSVEVWNADRRLVGGLYGVQIKNVFCGESMFSHESNASKAGFISMVQHFQGQIELIDCQIYTPHLASLGARLIDREEFLSYL